VYAMGGQPLLALNLVAFPSQLPLEILTQVMRVAFADTRWYVADPKFSPAPLDRLLPKKYAAERRARSFATSLGEAAKMRSFFRVSAIGFPLHRRKTQTAFFRPSSFCLHPSIPSHFSSTNLRVRYSPYCLISFSFSTRNVSPGKSSPYTSLGSRM